MATRLALHQFSDVFKIKNRHGQLYILIGGQAVNYWAERYLPEEPSLGKYLPFTSEDIDFYGNREDVQHIAGQLNLVPAFPPKAAITALAGAIPVRIGQHTTNIEVVRFLPGIQASMVDGLAVEMAWNNKVIRVLDPISLLISKIELAVTVSQANRQDFAHLEMLLFCVRGFLRELLQEVEKGTVAAKAWLGAVNRLFRLSRSTRAHKAAKKIGVVWAELLPLSEIARSRNQKIILFAEIHLPRF